MSSWTPRHVLDAVAAMEWCPDGATEVLTGDYRLIRYPDWALDPTFPTAQVTRSRSQRDAAEVIGEVLDRVRGWGRPGVAWWVSSATVPLDTEAALRAAGGKQIDAVRILARELNGDDAGPARAGDVSVELVTDKATFRAAWSSFRVLASVRGEPASVGGCSLHGEVAKLWGAVTLREYRRRGAYRAVLAERLRLARAHGAMLALAKGRNETSGPILIRSGFTDYGEERCYWLPVV